MILNSTRRVLAGTVRILEKVDVFLRCVEQRLDPEPNLKESRHHAPRERGPSLDDLWDVFSEMVRVDDSIGSGVAAAEVVPLQLKIAELTLTMQRFFEYGREDDIAEFLEAVFENPYPDEPMDNPRALVAVILALDWVFWTAVDDGPTILGKGFRELCDLFVLKNPAMQNSKELLEATRWIARSDAYTGA